MRHRVADVYKAGVLAARLERHEGGTRFSYLPAYLAAGGPAVASSLPLTAEPVLSAAGAAPPYFTGLLPEGRRLNALRRSVKTSVDDELSLLIVAGANPVGDVQIVGHGEPLDPDEHAVELNPKTPVDFDALLGDSGLIDPVALAGVQDKLSAGMISMPVASAGRRYILKLNAPEFPHVVENELVMFRYAAKLRIPLSKVRLIRDVGGRPGLLVERFDRIPLPGGAHGAVQRLAVEDGAQVLRLYPADKYNVGYGQVCHALGGILRGAAAGVAEPGHPGCVRLAERERRSSCQERVDGAAAIGGVVHRAGVRHSLHRGLRRQDAGPDAGRQADAGSRGGISSAGPRGWGWPNAPRCRCWSWD